jgi:1-deoxy-D-xylulose-5-phosphate reductoisomerase
MKRIAILGATGSIGTQALDVVAAHDDLQVVALAAGSDVEGLVAAARATGAEVLALADPAAAERAAAELGRPVLSGPRALVELIDAAGATVVLNAVVGAAGLEASLDTLERGLDLALANKESLVAGGELVLAAARRGGGAILPVDSEHSALQQCLGELPREQLSSLVITASGGPFRGRTRAELADITVAQALAHPTWAMGAKITVDSATLMNKGLEVIEAHMLFGLPYDQIEVVVHPQSIVHGMARLRDGALIAHLGHPDMRVPISFALTYPERAAVDARPLEWTEAFSLDFEPPDLETFGCLRLAIAAGKAGGTAPAVLNAANEVAVAAFLTGEIGFLEIEALVDDALQHVPVQPLDDLAAVLAADGAARTRVAARIGEASA